MNHSGDIVPALVGVLLAGGLAAYSQQRDRSKIPDSYKWDLSELYPSDEAWKRAKEQLVSEFPEIDQFRGKLSQSSAQLLACLDFDSRIGKELARLSSYASMSSDLDTRDSTHLGMKQEISSLGPAYSAKAAYIEPEIQQIGRTAIEGLFAKEKKLEIYRHYLDDVLRRQAHTGTEGEEKIIADSGLMSSGPYDVFGIFSNADFPFSEVALSDGKTVKLDSAAFNLHRTAAHREDRAKVFSAYFGRAAEFRRTFARCWMQM